MKGSGHTEEEITEELERIKNGETWMGFDNLPKQYMGRDNRWKSHLFAIALNIFDWSLSFVEFFKIIELFFLF